MTLDSKLSKAVYLGNGFTTVFPFAFKVWNINHIAVTVTDAAGVSTDVTSNSTVTLTSSGGSVSYPNTGSPLPTGAKLAIVRNMPFTQSINLTTASRFDPQVLEDGLDQATAERQQILEQMARAVILPATSSESPEDVVASVYAARDDAAAAASSAAGSQFAAAASAGAAADSAATAAQSAMDATAAVPENFVVRVEAIEGKTAPATTTSRGIGRVATSADLVDGATINNGPAFLAAGDVVSVIEKWRFVVGEFYYFRHPTLKPGFAPCQGGVLADTVTHYPEIWAYLQTAEGQLLLKTEAEWQAMSTATWATLADGTKVGWNGIGGVPYYVQNLATGTLRLPDLRGMYAEAAGFDSLGVGGVDGDKVRNITARGIASRNDAGYCGDPRGAIAHIPEAQYYGSSGTPTPYQTQNDFNASRVVPTGSANAPRRWGALACCYLGTPAQ